MNKLQSAQRSRMTRWMRNLLLVWPVLTLTLASGAIGQPSDSAQKQLDVRAHILWSLGTSLDKLYWWDGFGKLAKWDTVRWRKWEIEQRSHRHLVDTYTAMKRMDFLYGAGLISVKELGEEYFGPLQWSQARFRPAFHDRNEPYIVHTPTGTYRVWTGSDTFVDFFEGQYDRTRLATMYAKMVSDARELGVTTDWLETFVEPFPRLYDNFLGESIALKELAHAGVIDADERRRHFTGDRQAGDVYSPDR